MFGSKHLCQHRVDSAEVLLLHRHCVATQHRNESPQFFCRGAVGEHVTRIELAVNTIHSVVSTFQLILQTATSDVKVFHPAHQMREKQEEDKTREQTTHAQTCDIMEGMRMERMRTETP